MKFIPKFTEEGLLRHAGVGTGVRAGRHQHIVQVDGGIGHRVGEVTQHVAKGKNLFIGISEQISTNIVKFRQR